MGQMTAQGMAAIEAASAARDRRLKTLISKPFDLNNKEHTDALAQYVNDFEFSVNQMYLFQGMSTGLTTWSGSWIIGFFLPIPDFADYFLSAFLYLGVAGYILERFSMTDFHNQLGEMKLIYNWCLKDNKPVYQGGADTSAMLAYPDVQRLIKLISPLCTNEFMLAWKQVTVAEEKHAPLVQAVSTFFSFFTPQKTGIDHNLVLDLKTKVEKREFNPGILTGFEQAIKYFASNPQFRELLKAKVMQPVDTIKAMMQYQVIQHAKTS